MNKLKIILAEDHNLVRNGIKMLLESQADIEVIAEADDGQQVLEHLAAGIIPDIVLADINMPQMDGISLIKAIKLTYPGIKVVILSMLDNEKYVMQAFMEGSYGYILKNVNESEMLFALKTVAGGDRYLCVELTETLLNRFIHQTSAQTEQEEVQVDLSMREIEVLHLVAEGYTNQEMADKLFLSKRTIEGHRQTLIDKTGSKNTASLIRFAVVNGYLN
ncbi:DNA-binding response regulator, NarL/FixJ family, contains REC and HTH domains [Pedobacter terrae]|uniref:DNA-binding response regulator, NarL/FixJ family, contains REC and HTH domains n=1 Tax=Pedobacter terrae TaxID=405671 RepID=A0A1G8B1G4_9SPHI|nr:response regulator transcription factor [Pedobacter terrae]SDH26470.1 DNA-binding response regulator, NarL/FixJ family, contains REC and HTH domains [Pedobacter terrae]